MMALVAKEIDSRKPAACVLSEAHPGDGSIAVSTFSGHRKMPCSPDKLLEAGPRGHLKVLVCAFVDHPPDVTKIIEEEPFECPISMLTEAYGMCHPLCSFVI